MEILFIDDEKDVLEQTKIFLEKEHEGLSIKTTDSAEKALSLLDGEDFDAIVSDYMMPDMDGLELLRILREDKESNIPFLIFTGKGWEEVAIEALNLGADRYLRKGGDPKSKYSVLSDAIFQEVERHRVEKELEESKKKLEVRNNALRVINSLSNSLHGSLDFQTVIDRAVNAMVGYTKSPSIALLLLDDEKEYLRRVKANGFLSKSLEGLSGRIKIEDSLTGKTVMRKEIVFSDDISEDDRIDSGVEEKLLDEGFVSVVSVPLFNRDEVVGVINLLFKEKYSLTRVEKESLRSIGNTIGLSLANSRYVDQLDKEIEERKRKEEKLKKSRQEYQELFKGLNDPVFVYGDNADIIKVNEKVIDRFGYSREELLEMNISDLVREDHQEELEDFVENMEDQSQVFETSFGTKQSKEVPVEISSSIIFYQDRKVVLCIARDITERRGAEKMFMDFFEEIPDMGFIINKNGVVQQVNESYLKHHGYDREKIVGKSLGDLPGILPENDREKTLERFEKMVEGEEVPSITVKYITEEGNERFAEMRSVPIKRPDFEGVIGIARDITEQKEAEEREEFLHSLLRHDLRNKIQIIRGYAELMEDFDLPEKTKKHLEKMGNAARNSTDLIQKVRVLREIETGEEIGSRSIDAAMDEVLGEYRDVAADEGFEIEHQVCEFEAKAGSLLEEVFANILENSIQHSGGDHIKISASEKENECVVTIEDNGRGIPDRSKEKIFEKGYHREDSSGSGLGMYMVKRIVEEYGGRVEVNDSGLGGSEFDVYLERA